MANSIGLDIPVKAFVVLAEKYTNAQYRNYEHRVGIARGGFGMRYHTMGHAVSVDFLDGMGSGRVEGDHLDKDETLTAWNFVLSIPLETPDMIDTLIDAFGIKSATAIFDCYFALKEAGYYGSEAR